jgi:predicted RND superfamily exporter protein
MAIWMIFVATMILLPILLFWFHKPRRYGMQVQKGLHSLAGHRIGRAIILVVTFGVIAFGGYSLKDAKLDWDAMNMLPRSAESVIGQKALAQTDYSADTVIVTASSPEEMRARVEKLEELRKGKDKDKGDECAAQRPVVARVESAERYERLLPEVTTEKVEAVVGLRAHRAFLDKIRGEAAAAQANPPAVEPTRIAESLERIADEAGNVAFDMKENDPQSPLTAAISALAETAEKLAARIRGGDAAQTAERLAGFQSWLMGQLADGLRIVMEGMDLDPLQVRA